MAINELIRQAITCEKERPRYAYMAPLYKQAKEIAWDYLKHYAGAIPGAHFNESELRADLPNGARIKLLGAENADALRGIYLDGVVADEYAYMSPEVMPAVVRPALADRKGFVIFLGTPLGRNHFHKLWETMRAREDTVTALWRASETNVLDPEELERARAEMTPELYAQEFECSFEAAIQGAYYARELEGARASGRIRTVPWEPAIPVDTYWDLGWDDATGVAFVQRIGRELHFLEYVEDRNRDLAYYANVIQSRPFVYGRHYLPHDADAHELGSGKTRTEILEGLGVKPITVMGRNEPLDGINQGRLLFPRCWFDERKCARMLDALGAYRAQWDGKRMAFKEDPYHDWTSHPADVFRLAAIATRDFRTDLASLSAPKAPARVTFSPYTFDRRPAKTAWNLR
jgi:phage terminase large subunit